jgi:hypothetical protein
MALLISTSCGEESAATACPAFLSNRASVTFGIRSGRLRRVVDRVLKVQIGNKKQRWRLDRSQRRRVAAKSERRRDCHCL